MLGTHSPSMQQRSLCYEDELCHVSTRHVSRVHVSRADTDHVWSTVSGCLWCDHRSVIILWQLGHITISTTHYTYINGPPIVSSLSLILKEYIYLDRVVETWKVFNKLSYRDFLEAVSRGAFSSLSLVYSFIQVSPCSSRHRCHCVVVGQGAVLCTTVLVIVWVVMK